MFRAALSVCFLILLAGMGFAFDVNMMVFAVTESGAGVPATLTVKATQGKGDVAIDLGKSIVGELTQESVREATSAAVRLAGAERNEFDFFVKIESPAEKIDGPSAGLAIALATYGAIVEKDVDDSISATGQIDADGTIYPVGATFQKARVAHENGIKIFLIPAGERKVPAEIEEEIEPGIVKTVEKTVDIVDYAKQNWGMDVFEVSRLEDAVKIVFEGERPEQNAVVSESDEFDEFIPPPATITTSEGFEEVARKLVKRAKDAVEDARNCNLTLRDRNLEKVLRDSLKSAESMVKRATLLVDRGYYYTAANYAFLGTIDAEAFRRICEHPSILNPRSIVFGEIMQETENKINALESKLVDANVNKNNVEWISAARNRFIRAKHSFEMLGMGIDGENSANYPTIKRLMSIREWLKSAEEMYEKGKEIEGSQIGDLESLTKQMIISVEDLSEMANISNTSVQERIAWAKMAYGRGWYYTAAVEAASAKGLAFGEVLTNRKMPLTALNEVFDGAFEPKGLWDEVYQNHARYYHQAAKFYKKQGKDKKAEAMATTGVQLYYMAEEIKKINEEIQATPAIVIHVEREVKQGVFGDTSTFIIATAVLAISSILLIVLIFVGKGDRETVAKAHRYRRKIAELEKELKGLEKRLEEEGENKELRLEIAKIKRLIGRYRSVLDRTTSGKA